MIKIRTAIESDLAALQNIDGAMIEDKSRESFVTRSIQKRECIVSLSNGRVVGYAIFNKEFFDRMFIWLLFVSKDSRRIGVGTSLIRYVESQCEASTVLFTSTNQSNIAMQNMMKKLEFSRTGYVENLDEGDPELFYCKKI